jgi:hypothetical protein
VVVKCISFMTVIVQRVSRGAEAEKGGLLRLLLVRRCKVSDRATERWMLSSTSTAGFTVCGLRLAHCRWRATFFAFYTAYPQKRITAEIELIDKRNVQTYVDGTVIRPPAIPSGLPLTQTARDLIQHKLCTIGE